MIMAVIVAVIVAVIMGLRMAVVVMRARQRNLTPRHLFTRKFDREAQVVSRGAKLTFY